MFETHIEDLLKASHPYRKLLNLIDFKWLTKSLRSLYDEDHGRPCYNIESSFAALVFDYQGPVIKIF